MEKKTTVFINTLPIQKDSGGIKTFLLELLEAFAEIKNPAFQYNLICTHSNKEVFASFIGRPGFSQTVVHADNTNPFKRIFFEQTKLNSLFKNETKAILLNICSVAVIKCSIPQVTIIQAALTIRGLRKTLPRKYVSVSLMHKIYYSLFLDRSLQVSKKTIAISNYMVQFLGKYKEKIVMIHEGVNTENFQNDLRSNQNVIGEPYILSLSTLYPYKNMDKVIEAFSIFQKNYSKNYKLVIAGGDPDGKQFPYLKNLAEDLGISDNVIFYGLVKHEDVPVLYKGASLFLYLSSVEFFGLPVLESMASGVPLIASNKMSIPEVTNDAGILVEPNDIENIAVQMQKILTSKELRDDLVDKGYQNIKLFSWHKTASKFEETFSVVAN
jgi:glycosyltransferase involved in cell wall biosynthesis